MPDEVRLYYVSDNAYRHLVSLATQQGYKRFATERARGMSEFLNDLAYYQFEDTRPPNVVARHYQEISNNRAPTWTSYTLRRTRALTLTVPSIARYMLLAEKVGITHKDHYLVGGPSITKPVQVVGFVLEGLGLRWITPTKLPIKRTAIE